MMVQNEYQVSLSVHIGDKGCNLTRKVGEYDDLPFTLKDLLQDLGIRFLESDSRDVIACPEKSCLQDRPGCETIGVIVVEETYFF